MKVDTCVSGECKVITFIEEKIEIKENTIFLGIGKNKILCSPNHQFEVFRDSLWTFTEAENLKEGDSITVCAHSLSKGQNILGSDGKSHLIL